jgi:multidrug efflux pump subunit AcrA (membrane-fusion protein)
MARLRRVSLGDVSGNMIAVRQGLAPGDRVIVRGATIVADGQPVRVMP